MNCINEETIQAYIDDELNIDTKAEVEKHITDCEICRDNIASQKELAQFFKKELTLNNDVEVPGFDFENNPKDVKRKITIRQVLFVVAAASIVIALLFGFPQTQESELEDTAMQINNFEFDANKSITDQEFEITVVNAEGEIINY